MYATFRPNRVTEPLLFMYRTDSFLKHVIRFNNLLSQTISLQASLAAITSASLIEIDVCLRLSQVIIPHFNCAFKIPRNSFFFNYVFKSRIF